ncbi:hypothetical protein BE21_25575 [Sorangium cellulosum]|uniref:Uncharacterized protein n=1 Tax=Sorangium cellulosum TaxID=56 RepID=A0A150TTT2_SORCE|nr:hypothetical protein BE21_25575 [Sorangium cellulosum]
MHLLLGVGRGDGDPQLLLGLSKSSCVKLKSLQPLSRAILAAWYIVMCASLSRNTTPSLPMSAGITPRWTSVTVGRHKKSSAPTRRASSSAPRA